MSGRLPHNIVQHQIFGLKIFHLLEIARSEKFPRPNFALFRLVIIQSIIKLIK